MVLVRNDQSFLLDSEWGKLVSVDPIEEDDDVDDQQRYHASFLEDVYDGEDLYQAEAVQEDDAAAAAAVGADVPVVSATLLDPYFLNPIDTSVSGGRPRLSFDAADPTVDALLSYSRPQYIFASARVSGCLFKKNLGIQLKTRRRINGLVCGTVVAGIADDSPFHGCNIQPGDHVVSVNNYLCSSVNSGRVLELLQSTKQQDDVVSICVYNTTGDPNTVSSSVMKPDRTTKVGVALQMTRGAVRTSRVDRDGLFANSLLMPRHRCTMINGISCSHMSSKTAADLILSLSGRVTIISRPQESYAVTIALCQKQNWWRKVSRRAGLPAVASQIDTPFTRLKVVAQESNS